MRITLLKKTRLTYGVHLRHQCNGLMTLFTLRSNVVYKSGLKLDNSLSHATRVT